MCIKFYYKNEKEITMGNNIPLSIIVPVYNMERFLPKCLDSILSQTFRDFELLCVNDGSEDGSQSVLESYAALDGRIKIIVKENGGLVSARKAGLAQARGEFIGFVDSDDWIEAEMFARLYEEAKLHDADCVSSGYIQEGNYVSVAYDSVTAGVYKCKAMHRLREKIILDLEHHDKGIGGSLCTKLIRSNILKRVLPGIPSEITLSEDKVTSISALLECESVVVLHEAYYHYILQSFSMTQSSNINYLIQVNHVYRYLVSLYSHPLFTKAMQCQSELYITQLLIKGINSRLGFSIKNLLWIDPYWLKEIPLGAKVVLYGGGALGEKYYQQMIAFGKHEFVAFADFNYMDMVSRSSVVLSPDKLCSMEYDCLVITVKNQEKSLEIRSNLLKCGIEESKIFWFPQEEIFWRFAEADGLLTVDSYLDGEGK